MKATLKQANKCGRFLSGQILTRKKSRPPRQGEDIPDGVILVLETINYSDPSGVLGNSFCYKILTSDGIVEVWNKEYVDDKYKAIS